MREGGKEGRERREGEVQCIFSPLFFSLRSRFVNDDWMIDKGFLEVPTKLTSQW